MTKATEPTAGHFAGCSWVSESGQCFWKRLGIEKVQHRVLKPQVNSTPCLALFWALWAQGGQCQGATDHQDSSWGAWADRTGESVVGRSIIM